MPLTRVLLLFKWRRARSAGILCSYWRKVSESTAAGICTGRIASGSSGEFVAPVDRAKCHVLLLLGHGQQGALDAGFHLVRLVGSCCLCGRRSRAMFMGFGDLGAAGPLARIGGQGTGVSGVNPDDGSKGEGHRLCRQSL